jgi:splicing factor 3B subunit 2
MGKLDIDYRTLHDAFFRYQTKPRLTQYGDLYYEGKEYEVEMHEKRPGVLSQELRDALGMPDGAPPPWLLAMQRFGPPPSYPNLRVPGVNAPLPSGAEVGMHAGGWGRPGEASMQGGLDDAPPPIDISHWGELPPETQTERSDEEEEGGGGAESDEEDKTAEAGGADHADTGGLVSGLETPLSGLETPQHVEGTLRKTKALYEVLHEAPASVGGALMGSERTYSRAGGEERVDLLKSQRTEAVELALAPEEIGKLTEDQLKKRYEKAVQERQGSAAAPHGTKRKDRDDSDEEDGGHKSKKKREFKF